jgi:hypothetical protein
MLRGVLDLIFGAVILWSGGYGLWSGIKYGVFRGGCFAVRASPDRQPITFWAMVLINSTLAIGALLYLLVVLWRMLRQMEAP